MCEVEVDLYVYLVSVKTMIFKMFVKEGGLVQ